MCPVPPGQAVTAKGRSSLRRLAGGLVKVAARDTPDAGQERRLGFHDGQMVVPDDFDALDAELIEQMFGGGR
ncbi:MAG: type II toxin-antitoxin system prevent-host-death family antitoxin [Rhodocyclales bacterium]|nr:type II toxin-antitoxin system prevent-host-death family antitoxin [Rhodocyclales bacterium]